jgi:hypothetical protein
MGGLPTGTGGAPVATGGTPGGCGSPPVVCGEVDPCACACSFPGMIEREGEGVLFRCTETGCLRVEASNCARNDPLGAVGPVITGCPCMAPEGEYCCQDIDAAFACQSGLWSESAGAIICDGPSPDTRGPACGLPPRAGPPSKEPSAARRLTRARRSSAAARSRTKRSSAGPPPAPMARSDPAGPLRPVQALPRGPDTDGSMGPTFHFDWLPRSYGLMARPTIEPGKWSVGPLSWLCLGPASLARKPHG